MSAFLTGVAAVGTAMVLLIAGALGSGLWSPELTRRWPGRLRGCLAWEPVTPRTRDVTAQPRRVPANRRETVLVWLMAWQMRRDMKRRARVLRPSRPVNGQNLGTQPRRQRPHKQPWQTAEQPRLPEMLP